MRNLHQCAIWTISCQLPSLIPDGFSRGGREVVVSFASPYLMYWYKLYQMTSGAGWKSLEVPCISFSTWVQLFNTPLRQDEDPERFISLLNFFFNVSSVGYSFHKVLLKKKFKNTNIENSCWNSWSSDFQSHNEKLVEIWAGWECRMRWSNLLLVILWLNALVALHQIPIQNKRVQGKLITQSPIEIDIE